MELPLAAPALLGRFNQQKEVGLKTIGLLGGMSWESTLDYYRILNETVKKRLGGLHSAPCILYSVDFAEIEKLQHENRWDQALEILAQASRSIEIAGADCLVICTNTMHKLAPEIQQQLSIPLLHIADPTARKVRTAGLRTVALLGTRFTMEEDFYRGRLEIPHGLQVLIPPEADRQTVHRVIYEELCRGITTAESSDSYARIIERLIDAGAEGVVLGCTEIGMLVKQKDYRIPLFDTTRIHAEAAVDFALEQ
jgi:aspartate racemase